MAFQVTYYLIIGMQHPFENSSQGCPIADATTEEEIDLNVVKSFLIISTTPFPDCDLG